MTSRRTYQGAQPLLEIRRDEVEPACAGRWDIYDVLIDPHRGDPVNFAVRQAREICGSCPLQTKCLRENRDEPWARLVLGVKAAPITRDTCGTNAGEQSHRRHGEYQCATCKEFSRRRYHERKREAAA